MFELCTRYSISDLWHQWCLLNRYGGAANIFAMNITDSYPVLNIMLSEYRGVYVTKARWWTCASYRLISKQLSVFQWWQSHIYIYDTIRLESLWHFYSQGVHLDFHTQLFHSCNAATWCLSDHSVALASRIRNEKKVTVSWVTSPWTVIRDLLLHSAVSQRPRLGRFQWYYWCISDVSFILLCLLICCKWDCIRGIFFYLNLFEFRIWVISACTLSRWPCGTCMRPPHNLLFLWLWILVWIHLICTRTSPTPPPPGFVLYLPQILLQCLILYAAALYLQSLSC